MESIFKKWDEHVALIRTTGSDFLRTAIKRKTQKPNNSMNQQHNTRIKAIRKAIFSEALSLQDMATGDLKRKQQQLLDEAIAAADKCAKALDALIDHNKTINQ